MVAVTAGFYLLERGTDFCFHFIKQRGAESIAQEGVAKVIDAAPETVVTVTAFRNETMNMGIPFQGPAKGMKNHNKTGSEVQGLILLEKHT